MGFLIRNLFWQKVIILCFTLSLSAMEKEQVVKFSFKEDFKETFKLLIKGSYLQFTAKDNLYVFVAAIPALSHTFDYDVHYRRVISRQNPSGWVQTFNDIGTITTFPVVPGIAYYYAQKLGDKKLRRFAIELTATTYLALGESALLSFLDVHDRPSSQDLNKWETDFRGDSSFPSGHMIPLAALTYKTYQHYGLRWSLLPGALSLIQSYQRVQDDKHWMSDVIGGYFVVLLADNGVRQAWQKSEETKNKPQSSFLVVPGYERVSLSYNVSF